MSEFVGIKSLKGRDWAFGCEGVPQGDPAVGIAEMRGFDADSFLKASVKDTMPDPSKLKDMDRAVAAFCDAVEANKKIAIYGDYDVDGATSTALGLRWLKFVGMEPLFYIPDRMKEGYGPNANAMHTLKGEGVEFLLVLDSGTTAHEPLGVAAELGFEIVILDHHEPDSKSPPGILVNPKRKDEDRAFDYLCTAGLIFLFLVGVNREMRNRGFFNDERPAPNLMNWIGIVALGTVADLVPLVGLNRAYVRAGLPRMKDVMGIAQLANVNDHFDYDEVSCGFVFGPCINAAGRIDDTRLGATLLSVDDHDDAFNLAARLFELNAQRKDMQKIALEQATLEAEERSGDRILILMNEDWHPGIVGLVASKLKDATDKSTVIIGHGGHGSCRGLDGFDIGAAVIAAREAGILIKGGGHAPAAGLTIDPSRIDDLRDFMNERAKDFSHPPVTYDLKLAPGELKATFIDKLEPLRPYGMGNKKPRVAVVGGWVKRVIVRKEKHINIVVTGPAGDTEAMIWNAIGTPLGDALVGSEDFYVDLAGDAKIDTYGYRRGVLIVDDAVVHGAAESEAA